MVAMLLPWLLGACVAGNQFEFKPLNIAIHCSPLTKSHVLPLLEISETLIKRGHTVTFAAFNSALVHSKGYSVAHHSFGFWPGDPDALDDHVNATLQQVGPIARLEKSFRMVVNYQRTIYTETVGPFTKFLKDTAPDLLVCDHAAPVCLDLANAKGIPLVIGFQALGTQDWDTPSYLTANLVAGPLTTQNMLIKDRAIDLYNKYYRLKRFFSPFRNLIRDLRRQHGLPVRQPVYKLSEYGLSLSSSFLGFEPAQPQDPRVQLVGPITANTVVQPDASVEAFLNNHKRVLYIAFGSLTPLTPDPIRLLLQAALEAMSNGVIDGLVWGLGKTETKDFPETVLLGGKEFKTKSFLDSNHIRVLEWAPQPQILAHKNTKLFISHGGLTSCLEAINSLTPVIGMGGFFDQFKNIAKLVHNHVGLSIDHTTTPAALQEMIRLVIKDKDGLYRANLQRMKILAHFGQRRLAVAADLVEEHAYLAKACRPYEPYDPSASLPPCELKHRVPVGSVMKFLKANNIDLYALLVLTFVSVVYFVCLFVYTLLEFVGIRSAEIKRKTD